MTQPVNFPIAKLLKEKGFDKRSEPYRYNNIGELTFLGGLNAPTIAEVVMWLYEKYGMWVSVQRHEPKALFNYVIIYQDNTAVKESRGKGYNSPDEAYEAGIEFTLKKLL